MLPPESVAHELSFDTLRGTQSLGRGWIGTHVLREAKAMVAECPAEVAHYDLRIQLAVIVAAECRCSTEDSRDPQSVTENTLPFEQATSVDGAMANDKDVRQALDEIANALQPAVLLAAKLRRELGDRVEDAAHLEAALDRAARAFSKLRPQR